MGVSMLEESAQEIKKFRFDEKKLKEVRLDESLLIGDSAMRVAIKFSDKNYLDLKVKPTKRVAISVNESDASHATAIMWQIDQACRQAFQDEGKITNRRKFKILSDVTHHAPYPLGAMIYAAADKEIPPYHQKIEFLLFLPSLIPRVTPGDEAKPSVARLHSSECIGRKDTTGRAGSLLTGGTREVSFNREGEEPEVFIGITGQHFKSTGPGPDAPVDDRWAGAVFAVVDLDLCPPILQKALTA